VLTRHTGPRLIIYMINSQSGPQYGKRVYWAALLSQEKHLNENLNFNLFLAFVFSSSHRFRPNASTGKKVSLALWNLSLQCEKGSPEAWGRPFVKEDYDYDAFDLYHANDLIQIRLIP